MNRAQRRKMAKRIHGDFKGMDTPALPERSKEAYCWLHGIKFDDPKNPTPADFARAERIKLVPFKRKDEETGELIMGRMCPKCGNTVFLTQKDKITGGGLEGYTTEPEKDKINHGLNF